MKNEMGLRLMRLGNGIRGSDGNWWGWLRFGTIVCKPLQFNKLPSCERFVALMPRLLLPSYLLVHWFSGERSGIYFVDSTKLAVCHNARGRQHKVF